MKKLLTQQNVPKCVVKLSYFFQPAASSGLGVMAFLVNVTDFLFAYNHGQNILATFWAPHTAHDRCNELKHNGLGAHTPYPHPHINVGWVAGRVGFGHRPNIDYGGQGGAGMGKTLPNILTMIVWKIGKMKKKRVNSKSSSTETLGPNLLKIAGCIEHTNMLVIFDRHCSTNLFIELMNI